MQLVYPKGDYDLRKYSYLFDATANTDFTTVPELIEVLRNARATPRSVSGTDVVLHEMCGIVNYPAGSTKRLYLTRVGFVGGVPDFSTPQKFLQTFVPTIIGTGQRTDNLNNVDPPVRDGTSGQIVFPKLTSVTQFQGMTCFYPTKVGQSGIGVTSYAFTSMSSFIQKGFAGGSMTQRRAQFGVNLATANTTQTLMTYDSSVGGVGMGLNLTQTQTSGMTGFCWAYNTFESNRASDPERQNNIDPNVPFLATSGLVLDPAQIQLTKGLAVYWSPERLFCIKLAQGTDFSFAATVPGEVASGTMVELPKILQQRVFNL